MTDPIAEGRPARLTEWPYPLPPLPAHLYWTAPEPLPTGGGSPIFCVEDSDGFDLYSYRAKSILYSGQTAFQSIAIVDSYNFGRMLLLDGSVQSAEDDEALYHEMLVQPAMLAHPDPRDVLIVGGGEGATLREVLAHRSVRQATMVDIDREAVELCKTYLQSWHRGAFEDPRARLVFDDGRRFIETNSDDLYDVVIIDIVDMLDNGPAQALYTRQFYEMLRSRMRKGAIVVVQGLEFTFLDFGGHAALYRTLRSVFRYVTSYSCTIPSFLAPWGFLIASDDFDLPGMSAEAFDAAIRRKLGDDWMVHVDGRFIVASQCYDKETAILLALPGPILEDGVPFTPPPDLADTFPLTMKLPALDE